MHVLVDDKDLTTQEAAELLGLSRTFVVRLIVRGKLAALFAGSHRRVRTAEALAYARRRQARLAAVERNVLADQPRRMGGSRPCRPAYRITVSRL